MATTFNRQAVPDGTDQLGFGGILDFIGEDGSVIIQAQPRPEGAYFYNKSPVDIFLGLNVRFTEIYKSGTNRPQWKIGNNNTELPRVYGSNAITIGGGPDGKGMSLDIKVVVRPGGFMRIVMLDVDYSQVVRGPIIDIMATDDVITPIIKPLPPIREPPDDDEEVPVPSTDPSDKPTVLSWNGPTQNMGMGLQQYAGGFPPGILVETVSTSQGMRQFMRNNGNAVYTAMLFYYLADYGGAWYSTGNIDGESVSVNGHSRVVAYVDLSPGSTFSYEPVVMGNYQSYSSIVFRRCAFADRYLYGQFN